VVGKGKSCNTSLLARPRFIAEFITPHGHQSDNANVTIMRGVIVHLGILAVILLLINPCRRTR
jgi:hypothetical protein